MNFIKIAPLFALALAACPGTPGKVCDTGDTDCELLTDTGTDITDPAADFIILEYAINCEGSTATMTAATSAFVGGDRYFYNIDTKFSPSYDVLVSGTDVTTGTNGEEGTMSATLDFSSEGTNDGEYAFECRDVLPEDGNYSVTSAVYAADESGNASDCVIWGQDATAFAADPEGYGLTPPSELGADCYIDNTYEN